MTDNVTPIRPALVRQFEAEMTRLGLSQNRVVRQLGLSTAAVSQWRAGKYTGNNAAVEAAVRKWLDTGEELAGRRLDGARLDAHLTLDVTGEISSLLAHAQATADVVLVKGASGVGKTWAAKRYAETRSAAHYVMMRRAVRSLSGMLGLVAGAIGATGDMTSALKAEESVIAALRDRSALLLIDEAHHLTPRLLDELRCIRDIAGCGLALIGDESIDMPLARCPQIIGRIGGRFARKVAPDSDIELLVSAFLERPAKRREVALAVAAARGDGGLHALRRMLARAWMFARIEDRDAVTLADLEMASGAAPEPEAPDAKAAMA